MGASLKSFFERLRDDGLIISERDLRWVAHLYFESLGSATASKQYGSKRLGLEEIVKDLMRLYAHTRYREAA
jgi:hypothetical protein